MKTIDVRSPQEELLAVQAWAKDNDIDLTFAMSVDIEDGVATIHRFKANESGEYGRKIAIKDGAPVHDEDLVVPCDLEETLCAS